MYNLVEQARIVEGIAPAADAGGRTGAGISLKNAGLAFLVVHVLQGNAAQVTITPQQCTAVAGTSAKAIPVVPIWTNEDEAAADGLTRQTDAASFQTSAAVKHKVIVFQINPAALDVAGGFDCVNFTTSASNAANITEAMWYVTDYRYEGQQVNAPSAILD